MKMRQISARQNLEKLYRKNQYPLIYTIEFQVDLGSKKNQQKKKIHCRSLVGDISLHFRDEKRL